MRAAVAAIAILLVSVHPGLSETCHEKFVRLMVGGNSDQPVKIHVTQAQKGAKPSTNNFFQQSPGHWMTQMIEPANQPWVLTHNNTMFTSADEGKSWQKIRTLDSEHNDENARNDRRKNAETVRNAVCGEEALDGVAHETVEADFNTLQSYKTENHYKYWVNRETGWISKATYRTKGEGYEGVSTQLIVAAPELSLPTPE